MGKIPQLDFEIFYFLTFHSLDVVCCMKKRAPIAAGIKIRTVYPRSDKVIAVLLSIMYLLERYAMDHSLTPRPEILTGKQDIERETIQIADKSRKGMLIPRESEIV